ncbi:hypothetical protein BG005_004336 [Podila minutissima]|nr:hypothetical protein BG005_004336 [Podila minutissima]
MQHCWNLISNNPGIERLDFGGRHPSPIGRESGPDQVFIERLSKVKHLKELKNLNIFEPSQIWELLAAAPTIVSLSIFTSCWRIPDPLPEVNRTLRTLYVDCLDGVRDVRDILDLFPNLSHLAVPRGTSYFSYCSKAFCTWQGHFSRLSIQSIRSLDVNLNQDWDEVLCQLPNLAELTTDNRLNKPLSLALIKNCHKLKAIRLRKIPMCIADSKESRPVHDPANQLLVSMGHLRVLDSLVSFIHTDEMLRQPWACMGLEQLTCRIVGVDRLNESEQLTVDQVIASGYSGELSMEQVKAVEKFDRCQVQQHGVYDRLAKLTRLKHLDLGFENRDPRICAWDGYLIDGKFHLRYNGPTFDTLELSLASGLDRLGALKDLEMIGLECINHRIGRAEVVWMAKSWPNLNLVYGLDKEKVWAVEPDPTRAELKAYLQQLRPDVMHGTLYHGKS